MGGDMPTQEAAWLEDVKQYMGECLDARPGPIVPIVREHLRSGGKLIRPRLIFKVLQVANGEASLAREWAAAIELLHNATLVHDDYQDGDTHRRGQPTVWMKHGGPQAINAGDYLWSTAFHALASREQEDGKTLGLIRLLSDMAMEVVQGQALELSPLEDGIALREHYLDIIRGKTSGLFRTPARGALHLAGTPESNMERLSHHFEELGLLFQLQDDLLDLYGDKGRSEVGEDLREGKLSFLIVTHVEVHPEAQDRCLEFLRRHREEISADEVSGWIEKFRTDGTLDAALAEFKAREEKLLSNLEIDLPQYKELFVELVEMIKKPVGHLFP